MHDNEYIVAYNNVTFEILCPKCISTQNLDSKNLTVYPEAMYQVKENIVSARTLV